MKKLGNIMMMIGMVGVFGVVIYVCFMESILGGCLLVFFIIMALGVVLTESGSPYN